MIWLALLAGVGTAIRSGVATAKKVVISLADVPGLKDVGGSAIVGLKGRKILLVRVSDEKVVALDTLCTHQKCTVAYKKSWGEIRCPCHGSRFDKMGKVVTGPATKSLKSYPVSIKDGKIVIEL